MKNIFLKGLFISASVIFVTSFASAMTCTDLTKNLSKGSENNEVLKLQQFLFDSGYLTVKPNGYFGGGTLTAVKKFQKVNGLSQVGLVGPGTKGKIKSISCLVSKLDLEKNTDKIKLVTSKIPLLNESLELDRIKKFKSITILEGWIEYNFKTDKGGRIPNDLNELKKYLTDSGIFDNYTDNIVYTILNAKENKYKLCSQFSGETFIDISIFNKNSNEVYSVQANNLCLEINDPSKTSVVDGYVEIGKGYDSILSLRSIKDKLAYLAVKDKKVFIVYDGKEIGKEYDLATLPTVVNNKISYLVTLNNKDFIVYDGKEIGREYDLVTFPTDINNKLAYVAQKDNKDFIVYDGKEIGKEYDLAQYPIDIASKLAYMATKDKKTFIVYDGKEIGKEYDSTDSPFELNGKLLYVARKDNKNFIVYDEKKISKEYDSVTFSRDINAKFAYGVDVYQQVFVLYDGKEFGKEYDFAVQPIDVNNKLAYVARKDNKNFIVYDGKEIGKEYDSAAFPIRINNKLAYLARKDNKNFIVIEK